MSIGGAGIDSTLMTNRRGCLAAFPDALVAQLGSIPR